MKIDINIIFIIIIIIITLGFSIHKLVTFIVNKKKKEQVRILLTYEPSKKVNYAPSRNLAIMKYLMTPKYLWKIFHKQYINVSRYNNNENISPKKFLSLESTKMESNYYFNLVKNNSADNLFILQNIPKKYYSTFILPEISKMFPNPEKIIISIKLLVCSQSINFPTLFYKNDIFICSLSSIGEIFYAEPNITSELEPYVCYPFCRKSLEDKLKIELRNGDLIYIPNGTCFSLNLKYNKNQILFIIEIDNFQKNGKNDKEINLIKLEQIQMRKIDRKVLHKNLNKDEQELLLLEKHVNEKSLEKSINNPL